MNTAAAAASTEEAHRLEYHNPAFAPNDINVLIETPDKTFAEYVTHMTAAATGRLLHQLFAGYLVAEAGEIKLLRESFNPLTMAQPQHVFGGQTRTPYVIHIHKGDVEVRHLAHNHHGGALIVRGQDRLIVEARARDRRGLQGGRLPIHGNSAPRPTVVPPISTRQRART